MWKDYPEYERDMARFVSEFGFQAPAALRTWQEALSTAECSPWHPAVEHHNKQIEGQERLMRFVTAHFPLPTTFAEWIQAASLCRQKRSGALSSTGADGNFTLRERCSGNSTTAGLFQVGPSLTAAYGPRLHTSLHVVFAPELLSFKKNGESLEVWLTNDTPEPIRGTLTVQFRDVVGTVHPLVKEHIQIPANASRLVSVLAVSCLTLLQKQTHYLYARLDIGGGVCGGKPAVLCRTETPEAARARSESPCVDRTGWHILRQSDGPPVREGGNAGDQR